MSTSIKNLRQLAARDVKDHTAIFDSYVVLGRDIDYLAIKFGWAVLQENPDYDTSGCGRLGDLPRSLIEEYIEKFYPGIASENSQNDWISIDTYLQTFHAGWASRLNRK